MIKIKYMTDEAYLTLKKNIDIYTEKFIENPKDSSWIYDLIEGDVFEEKKYEIEDFDLKILSSIDDKETDIENSIILYEHLNHLPSYVLSEPSFWLWLMFEKFYEVSLSLMRSIKSSSFKHQWLFVDGNRRGIFFGVLSRCYFRVALSIDETLEDKYELTRFVIKFPDRMAGYTWRSISNHKHVIRGALKAEMRVVNEYKNQYSETDDFYRELAKDMSKLGSIKLIDIMSEKDIEDFIYKKYVEKVKNTILEKKETDYQSIVAKINNNNLKDAQSALNQIEKLGDYKDIEALKLKCIKQIEELSPKKKNIFNIFQKNRI